MIHTELIAPVSALLTQHAAQRPNKLAYKDARTSVTYAELASSTGHLAGHLQDAGIMPGDSVAIFYRTLWSG